MTRLGVTRLFWTSLVILAPHGEVQVSTTLEYLGIILSRVESNTSWVFSFQSMVKVKQRNKQPYLHLLISYLKEKEMFWKYWERIAKEVLKSSKKFWLQERPTWPVLNFVTPNFWFHFRNCWWCNIEELCDMKMKPYLWVVLVFAMILYHRSHIHPLSQR